MLFNSLHFLVFFTFVTVAYFSLGWKGRWLLLLAASCYFYAAFIPAYLLILFAVIAIDYVAGIWIERNRGGRRKALLIGSLVANVGLLAVFKYYNFANENLTHLLSVWGSQNPVPNLDQLIPGVVLPIGLSFHTFQSMSYTIEVYRGNQPAERHFGIYALYVLFYPQLVAGPIERPQNILPQLWTFPPFDWVRVRSGLMMMAWGMFKKVVIADRLALVVDPTYANLSTMNGSTLTLAAVFYSFQIYCDFSGYSDIAIGAGKVMGIRMMENFNTPYLASSISDFWRRWHISLSTWFRDYVYIPLGGNRISPVRTWVNTLLVFGLSGLWHGASWKFVVWGALHGFYLVMEQVFSRPNPRIAQPVADYQLSGWPGKLARQLITFALVTLTWIFFRASSLADAQLVLSRIVTEGVSGPLRINLNPVEIGFCILLISLLLGETRILAFTRRVDHNWHFWLAFPLLVGLCFALGVFTNNQFIYFQF